MTPRPVALVYCFWFGSFLSVVTTAFCPTLNCTADKSSLMKKYCVPGIYPKSRSLSASSSEMSVLVWSLLVPKASREQSSQGIKGEVF